MIPQHGTLEISSSALRANVNLFRRRLSPSTALCATIKANAYGHGVIPVATALRGAGISWACVYALDEALDIARNFPELRLLVLAPLVLSEHSHIPPALLKALTLEQIRLNLTDIPSALRLARLLSTQSPDRSLPPLPVHVQIDTGLTRMGITPAEAPALFEQILALPALRLEGIFSHLSHGEVPGHETVTRQVAELHRITDPLKRLHPSLLIHLQNSGGAWHAAHAHLDMCRVGIALYGLQPSSEDPIPGLQPIARLTAPILAIHERPAGVGVGYNHLFVTRRPSRLAIVPVGYADGYPRALTHHGVVQVHSAAAPEQTAPVVGRVSMDQIIIDITDLPAATVGDRITIMSPRPNDPNSVDRLAQLCQTISYEIATGWGPRLDRRLLD